MVAEEANFSCLCFVLEIWIKIAVFRRLPVLGWWIKISRIFLSARKQEFQAMEAFQVWKRSNFFLRLILFFLHGCVEMFRSNSRFVGFKENCPLDWTIASL